MGCVYQAINKINGKSYIGKTIGSMGKRSLEHFRCTKKKRSFYFHAALKKYGFDNFIWKELFSSDDDNLLCKKEKEFIKNLNTKPPFGYNLTDGGEGIIGNVGRPQITPETRIKQSLSKMGNKYRLGVKVSEKTKEKISKARRGKYHYPVSAFTKLKISLSKLGKKRKPFSLETRKNISVALLGNRYRRGKKSSEETKLKISRAMFGRTASNKTKLKMSESAKNRWLTSRNNWNVVGRLISPEHRKNLSNAARERWKLYHENN
jgi:group I intron endonuclease